MSVQIRNLSSAVVNDPGFENAIYELFGEYGEVESVQLKRSMTKWGEDLTYAIVEYGDPEMAENSLELLYTKLGGEPIHVFLNDEETIACVNKSDNIIRIMGIPKVKVEDLHSSCEEYGHVLFCTITNNMAFVQFYDAEAAEVAVEELDQTEIGCSRITVTRCTPYRTVFIENLPEVISSTDSLRNFLESFDDKIEISLCEKSTNAVCTFSSDDGARKALEISGAVLNGQELRIYHA